MAAVTFALLATTGCETTGNPLDNLTGSRGNRYCLQAGGLGTLGGAGVGAGIGALAGQSTEAALIGAAIGGVVGALAGCRYGLWVADRRESYDSEQARLDAELTNAQRTNDSLQELNRQLVSGLDDRRQELATLQQANASAPATIERRNRLRVELDENIQGVRQQLEVAENELNVHRRELAALQASSNAVDPEELTRYREEVEALEREVDELRGLSEQYASTAVLL